jgi:aspartate aminotransferase-like enzyme
MREHGLVIAGGQGKWSGKIMRFGHMGEVGIDEMAQALEIMGSLLPYFGHTPRIEPADAARAARDTYAAEAGATAHAG